MASWSLVAPRKRMAQAFRNLLDEFRSFSAEFQSAYDSAVASEMNKFEKVQESDDFERADIRLAVESAARCYHYVNWWPILRQALRKRFGMGLAVLAVIGIYVVLGMAMIGFPLLASMPPPVRLNTYDVWFSIITFIGFLIIIRSFYSRVPYPYKTPALALLAEAITFIAIRVVGELSPHTNFTWRTTVSPFLSLHQKYRIQVESMPIAHLLQWELWFIGLILWVACYRRIISFCGKTIVREVISGKMFGWGLPAEQCAEVVISLLDIRHFLTEVPDDNLLLCKPGHRCLQCKLGNLAFLIRGSWQETMRSRYRPAGEWIASHASRIELFIRHQQVKNMLLSSNLLELRDTITSTLVHAADGNWHLIGTDQEYANMVVAQRRTRIIRRAIAIAISVVLAITAPHFMQHYPALYPSIVGLCITFALMESLGLIYPDAPTGLDIAGRLTNVLKRGG